MSSTMQFTQSTARVLTWMLAFAACWFARDAVAQQRSSQPRTSTTQIIRIQQRQEGAWLPLHTYQMLRQQRRRSWRRRWVRLGEAHYHAQYTKGGFDIRATIKLEVKGKGWRRVGILPNAYPLHSAKLDGKPASIVAGHTRRLLAVRGEGKHTFSMHFFLPQRKGAEPSVVFQLAPAHVSHLKITFAGKGYRPKLKGGLHTRVQHKANGTTLSALVAPKTKPVLTWWLASDASSSAPKKARRTARLYARTYALLSAAHGGQELFLTVRYTIVHAPREQFRLLIPKGIHIRQVRGLGIRDYRILPDKQQRGQILDVLLTEPVTERYEISLLAEHRKGTGEIALRLPAPLGVQRETGYLGVEVVGNDALTVEPSGATSIDVQELPPEIIKGTQRPILRAYRFTRRPATWKLRVRKYNNVSIPAAMIDQALYLQVANHEGQVWVQATYQVRNTFKQFIAITLPKGARMQSAFVGGKPVKPAKDHLGRVLVPLKRSGKASGHAFPVEVVYSLRQHPYKGRVRHKAALPGVDLWIADMQWRLYLPRGQVNWHAPNLGRERPKGYSQWSLKSEFEISSRLRRAPPRQATVRSNKIHLQTRGQSGGVLPVRIKLPRRGRLYIFHRYHLAPQRTTKVTFAHQPPETGTLGLFLFLLGGLLLGFACARMMLHKRIDMFLPWGMLLAAGVCCSLGFHYTTYVSLTTVVLGALGGLVVATAIHIFQWLDQRSHAPTDDAKAKDDAKEPKDAKEPSEEKEPPKEADGSET